MKKILLLSALTICSNFAYAEVDLGAAFGGAIVTITIRGVIAFGLFKLITLHLTRKTTFTPLENGRWVGACLMFVSIISFRTVNKELIDFYFGIVLVSAFWLLIGFVIGYVWRKFKPLKLNGAITSKSSVETPRSKSISKDSESKYWELALQEFNSENRNAGLWAQCFSDCDGDENKAKARYLKEAYKRLSSSPEVASNNHHKIIESTSSKSTNFVIQELLDLWGHFNYIGRVCIVGIAILILISVLSKW
jgi:hypothetical protein